LDDARAVAGAQIYAAGVAEQRGTGLVTAGGRALDVVGMGADLGAARQLAYRAVGMLSWPDMVYRSDIAETAATPGSPA
jgi:phosphoribosylamine--glycine ligase